MLKHQPRSFTHLGAKGIGVNHLKQMEFGMIFPQANRVLSTAGRDAGQTKTTDV